MICSCWQSGALVPLASVILTFVVAMIIAKAARIKRQHFGLFCASVSNSNTIFVGIPVNLALFGEKFRALCLAVLCRQHRFFLDCGAVFHHQRHNLSGKQGKIPLRARMAQVFSPPLMGFTTGAVLTPLGAELPEFFAGCGAVAGQSDHAACHDIYWHFHLRHGLAQHKDKQGYGLAGCWAHGAGAALIMCGILYFFLCQRL